MNKQPKGSKTISPIPMDGDDLSRIERNSGKPKKSIFQCSEVAEKLKNSGDGMETADKVFDAASRVKKKLDEFLNTEDVLVVTKKSFYFSKIAL